jgi:tetratricopeptide (TPR) repeat protein
MRPPLHASVIVQGLMTLAISAPICAAQVSSLHEGSQQRFSTLEAQDTSCSVLVDTFNTESEATLQATSLRDAGYSPVVVMERGGNHEVHFGNFDVYVDAHLYRQELRRSGLATSADVCRHAASVAPQDPNAGRIRPVFDLEVAHISEMAESSLRGNPVFEEFESIRTLADHDTLGRVAMDHLSLCSPSDPVRGYLFTRLGILDLTEGDLESALDHFQAVANHDVPSDPVSRIKSMRRVAWIRHQLGDRLGAYQAYSEMYEFSGSDAVRSRAAVELVGLTMELARHSGIGSMADCRRVAEWALTVIPEGTDDADYIQWRSTVELMALETHNHEGDHSGSLALGESFVDRYTSIPTNVPWREVGQAMYLNGLNSYWLGDMGSAWSWYNRTLRDVPRGVEFFAGENPHAKALNSQAVILLDRGETQAAYDLLRRIVSDYPDENITANIRASYQNL